MNEPLVTIIIVNWNGKHHLADCLNSLRTQTFQIFQTVIIDNGSTDGSLSFIRQNFSEIEIHELDKNYGFCKPNNIGMRLAQSKYVCLLNNDTALDPFCIEALVESAEADSQIGICDAKQLLFDQRDIVFSVGSDYTIAGSNVGAGLYCDDKELDSNRTCFIGMAACVLYRKSMLDAIGLFDEDFFAGREDIDLSFRAQLAGYRVENVGRARCYHKISATRGQSSYEFVRRGQRNLHWVYFKNMPTKLLRRYLVHHIAYTLVTAVYFFRTGRGRAWLLAKWDVLRSINTLRAKRRQVQMLKSVSDSEISALLTKKWLLDTGKVNKLAKAWKLKPSI